MSDSGYPASETPSDHGVHSRTGSIDQSTVNMSTHHSPETKTTNDVDPDCDYAYVARVRSSGDQIYANPTSPFQRSYCGAKKQTRLAPNMAANLTGYGNHTSSVDVVRNGNSPRSVHSQDKIHGDSHVHASVIGNNSKDFQRAQSSPGGDGKGPSPLPHGYGGWKPAKSHPLPATGDMEEERRKAQVKAYVDWVNVQLKRRPGTRRVDDLRSDMQDGVALVHLIELVANVQLEGVSLSPEDGTQMLTNAESVINFMTSQRIRMHLTTAQDIVEGNLKAIMRLILALAAHYKPKSVKSTPARHRPRANQSLAGIAQGAAAVLADARQSFSTATVRPQRPAQLGACERSAGVGGDSQLAHRQSLDGASMASSPRSSGAGSPRLHDFTTPVTSGGGIIPKSRSQDFVPGHERPTPPPKPTSFSSPPEDVLSEVLTALTGDHSAMETDLHDTKQTLLRLEELLLSGQPPDGAESEEVCLPLEGSTLEEEVQILRHKLQHADSLCRGLRQDMSVVKTENMELQGVKAGLASRLGQQEQAALSVKAELLRAGFLQQSLDNTKTELDRQLAERDHTIAELRKEVSRRDRQLEDVQSVFHMRQQERESTTTSLRSQINHLNQRLKHVGDTETTLSARVATQDRKMSRLEGKILGHNDISQSPLSNLSGGSDDLVMVRESLRSLRGLFHGGDPQHRTIDQLELSISALMDRLHVTVEQDSRMSDCSRSRQSSSLHGSCHDYSGSVPNGQAATKVLYFTDRTVTPFMCSVPKRLGEVTLRDIKALFDRQGAYRYHFKAMDPEFGTVKEEITLDDQAVPGWEGKIVAWIEEDQG